MSQSKSPSRRNSSKGPRPQLKRRNSCNNLPEVSDDDAESADEESAAEMEEEVAQLAHAVSRGRRCLRKSDARGAIAVLSDALEKELPAEKREILRAEAAAASAQKTEAPVRKRHFTFELPDKFPPKEPLNGTEEKPVPTQGEMMAQVLRVLCIAHSKLCNWEAVCEHADLALEMRACPLPEELRLELLLRRGVALSHLAGASSGAVADPREIRMSELLRAEKDLKEVIAHNPKEAMAQCGLQSVSFLVAQVKATQGSEEKAPLRGLARIRAMDA